MSCGAWRQEKFLEVLGCGLELPGCAICRSLLISGDRGQVTELSVLLAQQPEDGKLMSEDQAPCLSTLNHICKRQEVKQ